MRNLIISCVLVTCSACSLYRGTERSELSAAPDAGSVNDACHNSSADAGSCCGGPVPDAGEYWPDGAPEDGGGYFPDGAPSWDGGVLLPDGGP